MSLRQSKPYARIIRGTLPTHALGSSTVALFELHTKRWRETRARIDFAKELRAFAKFRTHASVSRHVIFYDVNSRSKMCPHQQSSALATVHTFTVGRHSFANWWARNALLAVLLRG